MSNSYILVIKAISVILFAPVAISMIMRTDKRVYNRNVFGFSLILSLIGFTVLTIVWFILTFLWGLIFYLPEPAPGPITAMAGPGPRKGYELFLEVIIGFIDWVPFEVSLLIIAAAFLIRVLSTEGFAR